MDTATAFAIDLPGYSVHQLSPEDAGAVQRLFEQCLDYCLLVDGRGPAPNAAEEEFRDAPPGKSPDDLFIFGIISRQNDLAGLLEGVRGYPDETTWWIGLLLFAPEARAHGIGKQVVQGFAEYARASGVQAIMLGVVDENERACQFWNRLGFETVRQTEPRQFGNKTQTVRVMRRTLWAATMPVESNTGH
jgi:ribosomal protein S18 acetylase RimI-like enzyme